MSLRPKKQKAGRARKKTNARPKDIKPDWMPLWAAERMHYKKDMIMSNPNRAFVYPFIEGKTNKRVEYYWLDKAHKVKKDLSVKHNVKYIDIEYGSTSAMFRIMLKPAMGLSIDIDKILRTTIGSKKDYLKYQNRLGVTPYVNGIEIRIEVFPEDHEKLRAMWKE